MRISGILFDKDGTLLDFEASWSGVFRELCFELASGDAQAAASMLESGGMEVATGKVRSGSVLAAGNTIDIVRHWYPSLSGADFDAMVARIDAAFYANGIRCSVPIPGLRDALAALRRSGIAMGVATSDGTAGTRAALAVLGLEAYLPHVFGYDSVARPKPAPDIVHAFAAAIGATPAEIIVVGDNTHDLEMARNAGAGAAVGVLSGTGTPQHLAPLADAILGSVCELPAWLEARRNGG
jgi:phosphoglycolate phosphatase